MRPARWRGRSPVTGSSPSTVTSAAGTRPQRGPPGRLGLGVGTPWTAARGLVPLADAAARALRPGVGRRTAPRRRLAHRSDGRRLPPSRLRRRMRSSCSDGVASAEPQPPGARRNRPRANAARGRAAAPRGTVVKVLISAYACEPHKGSRGAGWNWSLAAGRENEVWVLTRANNRESIEAESHADRSRRSVSSTSIFRRGRDAGSMANAGCASTTRSGRLPRSAKQDSSTPGSASTSFTTSRSQTRGCRPSSDSWTRHSYSTRRCGAVGAASLLPNAWFTRRACQDSNSRDSGHSVVQTPLAGVACVGLAWYSLRTTRPRNAWTADRWGRGRTPKRLGRSHGP